MRGLTWDGLASKYGMKRCRHCQSGNHATGWSSRTTLHWADRTMTRAGLRRYLMLVAEQYLQGYASMPEWQRIYSRNLWAARAADRLHVRLPSVLADTDRARVAWLVTHDESAPASVHRWTRVRSIEQ